MKLIDQKIKNVITIDEAIQKRSPIVIAVFNDDNLGIVARDREGQGDYILRSLTRNFTDGNYYPCFTYPTLRKMLEALQISAGLKETQVFDDFHQALDWLSDQPLPTK